MKTLEKLEILADAAKYDVSCSSSGSNRKETEFGLGNASYAGICHSWADDGRCISLFKILFTNKCIYDCAYCNSRRSNDVERAEFDVNELVKLTIEFYKRNYIEGLFLSSGIVKNTDYTMEKLISVVKKLRVEENFNGYIHLKSIPGADLDLVREAGLYVDRLSANIELPSSESLLRLTEKKKEDIVSNMGLIKNRLIENKEERKKFRNAPIFTPAGQTTQLIVGATPDSDVQILRLSNALYKKFELKRVYFSAYIPGSTDSRVPSIPFPPLKREHRLYQADWLMRFYQFDAEEIIDPTSPFLDTDFDPKANWALRNIEKFPIEINEAPYEMILRVPGIGVGSALKIIKARKHSFLSYDNLKDIGVVLKRAKHFVLCKGKYYGASHDSINMVKESLKSRTDYYDVNQLRLF